MDALLADVRQRFLAEMDTVVHPTPGLFVLLDHLERRDLPLAVATSSRRDYADRLLTRHALADRFEFILASEDVTRGKPDPEIYRLAARGLPYRPARCWSWKTVRRAWPLPGGPARSRSACPMSTVRLMPSRMPTWSSRARRRLRS